MSVLRYAVLLNDRVLGLGVHSEEEAWAEAQLRADAKRLDLSRAVCRRIPVLERQPQRPMGVVRGKGRSILPG